MRKLLLSILITMPILSAHATVGSSFLKVPTGARPIAMGQSGTAEVAGAEAMFWNAALIGNKNDREFFFSHALFMENTAHSFAAYTAPFRNGGGYGVGVHYFGAGEIDQTDDIGRSVGTFTPRDAAVSGGFSIPWGVFRIGATGKYITSKILHSAHATTFDVGAHGVFFEGKTKVALTGENISGKIRYIDEEADLPRQIRLGASQRAFTRWTFVAEEIFSSTDDPALAGGAEVKVWSDPNLSALFRFGYSQGLARDKEGMAGVTSGVGLAWKRLNFDYAWVPFGDLGQTHTISLNYRY